MALLRQFGPQDEEILKAMQQRQQPAPVSQAQPSYVAPEQNIFQRMGGGIKDYLSDPSNRARLAVAFNSMRLNPDQNIAAMAQSRIDQERVKRGANRTAEQFRAMGREDIANMIEQNPSMALDLTKAYYSSQLKSPSAFSEKVKALSAFMPEKDAVKIAASSGGTTVNMPSVGSIPAGYQAIYDDAGRVVRMEPIAGGPVESELSEEQEKRKNAFAAYEVGIENVRKALGETATGYLFGKVPAITEGAQTFEAAGDLMAPILKDIFRGAGEGNFTDADQAILMNMLPRRGDSPAAARNKIQMLDQTVRAKLGMPLISYGQEETKKRLRFNPETNQLEEVGG